MMGKWKNKGERHIILLGLLYLVGVILINALLVWIDTGISAALVKKFIAIPVLAAIANLFWLFFVIVVFFVWKKYNNITLSPQLIFYGVLIFFILGCILAGSLTHGEAIRTMLHFDKADTFMDFFNSIQYGNQPYANKVIYPPLINVIYEFLGKFVIHQEVMERALYLRDSQVGLLVFGIYAGLVQLGLACMLFKMKAGEQKERIVFVLLLALSLPFLFAFERGNSILLALIFVLIYLRWYMSDSKKLRYLAFSALGIAAGIKISPAIFGILMLRERRFKDCLIALGMGCVIFMVPFCFTDGNPFILLDNIHHTTALAQGFHVGDHGELQLIGHGAYLNLLNTTGFLGRFFNVNLLDAGTWLNAAFLLLGIGCVAFQRKLVFWKAIGILSALLVVCPGFSAIYNLVYMVLPLLFFLNRKSGFGKKDYVYTILFLCMFVPMINLKMDVFRIFASDSYPVRISTLVESLSLLLFIGLLEAETIFSIYQSKIKGRKVLQRSLAFALFALCSIGIYSGTSGFSMHAIEAFYPSNLQTKHAGTGFILQDGQYREMRKSAEVLLDTKGILQDGLLISFAGKSEDGNAAAMEEISIYVDQQLLKKQSVDINHHTYLYLGPEDLAGMDLGHAALVKIVREDMDESYNAAVNYIGPAQPMEQMEGNVYLNHSSEGFWRDNATDEILMGLKGRVLLDRTVAKDGLLVEYHAARELFAMNPGKTLSFDVWVDHRKVKTITVDNLKQNTLVLQPEDLGLADSDADDSGAIELQLIANASYSLRAMGISANERERSLIIDRIGPCESDDVQNEIWIEKVYGWGTQAQFDDSVHNKYWLDGSKKFYFTTADLKEHGLDFVYAVPAALLNQKFLQDTCVELLVDGQVVKRKVLRKEMKAFIDAFHIPAENFVGRNHVAEVEVRVVNGVTEQEGFTEDNRYCRPILIKYLGGNGLSGAFKSKSLEEVNFFSMDIGYDKKNNLCRIGLDGSVLLSPVAITGKDLCIKYKVSPYLYEANRGRDLQLIIYVNDEAIKTIPLVQTGDLETEIEGRQLQEVLKKNTDCTLVNLQVNGTYNLSNMHIMNSERDDRSIDVTYIGIKE